MKSEVFIKDLGKVLTGNTPSKLESEFYNSKDIHFIKPDLIRYSTITEIDNSNEYLSEKARFRARIVPKDTVLVTCIGNIGKVGLVALNEVAFNQQINAIITNDLVIPRYLAYAIIANQKRLDSIANAPVVPLINKTQFENFSLFIHKDIEKQKRITDKLDKLSRIIELRSMELDEYDQLIKSRFVELFGTLESTKFGIENLNNLSNFITDGTHQTPTYTDDFITGFKFLSSKDVTSGKIDWSNIKYIPDDLHSQLYKRIAPKRNDILLAKNGTTGTAAIVDVDDIFDIYVSLAIIRLKELIINPLYALYAINSDDTKRQFDSSLKGVGVPNLHLGEIKKTKIIVPPIKLQEEFTIFVQQVDKLKFEVQKSLDETQQLFDSLMQEYFG